MNHSDDVFGVSVAMRYDVYLLFDRSLLSSFNENHDNHITMNLVKIVRVKSLLQLRPVVWAETA